MMKSEGITIKDIGKKLGISTSTVSRALRDMPDVNPETKTAVMEMAKALNYQPNLVALSLVTKRTKTIGVIIPSFTTYFYSEAISGIQEVAQKAGYHVMICHTNESYEAEKKNIEMMLSSRVDGIIASVTRETENFAHFESLINRGIPLVLFNRTCDLNVPKVQVNDYEGAYKATVHLIEQGCEKIAHITGPENLDLCRQRLRGYLDAMNHHKKKIYENLIIYSDFSIESGMACGKELLGKSVKPDGVFVVCDTAAYGAMHVFKQEGYRIPQDIAVVGFTNEPMSELFEPSLTTVAQPINKIGQAAAKMFIEMLEEGKNYIPETRILNSELIIRNSSKHRDF
jgi:DNA-binding LacI/PurR family transcriptional regulator